ncbi:FxLD family lanthipeptide [Streptomyces sp. NPDC001351]|uniref:FxLD family lanthipeptide n=1 Tax=Streptomyces sp. NPDC001351 TaxID=3364564 RepID=UPI0036A16BC1
MTVQMDEQATATTGPATDLLPFSDEDWQLEVTITDAPRSVPANCDTSDGCESSCASSCTSD